MANSTHNKMYSESTYRVGGNAKVSREPRGPQLNAELSAIGLDSTLELKLEKNLIDL